MTDSHHVVADRLSFQFFEQLDFDVCDIRSNATRLVGDGSHYYIPDLAFIPFQQQYRLPIARVASKCSADRSRSTGGDDVLEKLPKYKERVTRRSGLSIRSSGK